MTQPNVSNGLAVLEPPRIEEDLKQSFMKKVKVYTGTRPNSSHTLIKDLDFSSKDILLNSQQLQKAESLFTTSGMF